ncbi:MAG: hypothetical protein R3C19_06620 [Planctomycetaceae bacterium]
MPTRLTELILPPEAMTDLSGSMTQRTGAELLRLFGHRDWIEDLAFSPDGRSLVSASRDGTIKVWQVSTGEFLCDLFTSPVNRPFRLTFCPPDAKLAVRLERGQILLLDTSTNLP